MEKRTLGRTGQSLSMVGFGGIIVMNEEPASASRLVAQAVDRGINYFDVAPSYGNAEERLGPALEPYRQSVFLACKTHERSKEGAWQSLQQSLKNLKTDHFDLFQHHGVVTLAEVEQILGPGGAMEAFLDAKAKGLIRFIGFSAHSEEAALALMAGFQFDTILFPVNWACWYGGNFGPRVIAEAKTRGLGILALKSLAKRAWNDGEERKWPKCWYSPVDSADEAKLALRFTLTQPVTAAVSPSHAELLWWACDAAERFAPITDQEAKLLAERSTQVKTIFPQKHA
jgi:aryl-alcohol dehydrogenase-like predicted oxidoreductase